MKSTAAMATTGRDRVLRALAFRPVLDRAPRFWSLWPQFERAWRRGHGDADVYERFGRDMIVVAADETPWPSGAAVLERAGSTRVERNGWGVLHRYHDDVQLMEPIEPGVRERVDPDGLTFEDPALDARYTGAAALAHRHCDRLAVFAKTGGPYLRAAHMRGQEEFLMDLVEDPAWARAFIEKVSAHITTIGVESIRRLGVQETGIAIYDDVAAMAGPIMGLRLYEEFFLPSLVRMVRAYRAAGARHVMHHSDGAVEPLLEMWVAAGIDVVNPLEPRVCPHPEVVLRRFASKLAVIGGLDNAVILPGGNRDAVREHVRRLAETARAGGLVIAPHSIGPDISVETMEYVLTLLT